MKQMVWRSLGILLLIAIAGISVGFPAVAQTNDNRLITVYDRGTTKVFLTDQKTIGDALKDKSIELDSHDAVEPALSEELVANDYKVNIYRARPVVVVDGSVRIKTISAYQTAKEIAKDAGITVYDEDRTTLKPSTDFIGDGAGLQLTVSRALSISLNLYGNTTDVRTRAKTVAEFIKEKNIPLEANVRVSLPQDTVITQGLQLRIWREGIQTVTIEEPIPVLSRIVYDNDRPLGYRAVQSAGIVGNRSSTYQLEIKEGVERSRVQIASIVTRNPTEQIEVIGLRNDGGGLTKSKGAQYFTDSNGVSHRETYYDLPMGVVMNSCGQGGYYTVRPDGAKVDAQGYILIAANYGNYPKCSVVETSLGPGKVYDTGGFAARHPFGFDLATDWTAADGR
jgi:uncharacterized protein YabE (DUF348 family)